MQTKSVEAKYSQPYSSSSSGWWQPPGALYGNMVLSSDTTKKKYCSTVSEFKLLECGVPYEDEDPEDVMLSEEDANKSLQRSNPRANSKQIIRKKWIAFREDLDNILNEVHTGNKVSVSKILSIIRAGSLIEPLIENPGESFVSSINNDLVGLRKVIQ